MHGFQISVAHLIASGLSDPLKGSPILRELVKRSDSSAHIQVNEFATRVYCVHPSNGLEFTPTTDNSPGLRIQRVFSRGQVSVRPATALRVSRVAQLLRAEAAAEVGQTLHLEVAEMRVPGIRWETQDQLEL